MTRDFFLQEVTRFIFVTTTSCDVSASSLQVGEALIALHTKLMNACPLVEAGSKENWGRPEMPDLILLATLFNLYSFRKYHFHGNTPLKRLLFRGLMLRKVMPMQQLFEVNVKVRGRQTCVKIFKLGDSSLDGGV